MNAVILLFHRVALMNDSYKLHKILPSKVDPLVSLMKVEKVPDSTYEVRDVHCEKKFPSQMVGGLEKQVKEVKEVIELPVKHPEIFEALGIAQPKVPLRTLDLLHTGCSSLRSTWHWKNIACKGSCTSHRLHIHSVRRRARSLFFYVTFSCRVSGSELVQKYIGEGSRMVRELFVLAREHSPSIIFMDEVDSIGSQRLDGEHGDSEVQRTMMELLNQLDGFESTQNIKVCHVFVLPVFISGHHVHEQNRHSRRRTATPWTNRQEN
eukprot:284815740_4